VAKSYLIENRYSYLEDLRVLKLGGSYEVQNPSTTFEQQVQSDLAQARGYQLEDELGLALDGYQRLQALILKTVNPQLPVPAGSHPSWKAPFDLKVFDTLLASTAHSLASTPLTKPDIPSANIAPDPAPPEVAKALKPYVGLGPDGVPSAGLRPVVEAAADAAARGDWTAAEAGYRQALDQVKGDAVLKGYLQHDLGLVTERSGDPAAGKELLQQADKTFRTAKSPEGRVAALTTLAGLATRRGDTADATEALDLAAAVASTSGVHPISVMGARGAEAAPVLAAAPHVLVDGGQLQPRPAPLPAPAPAAGAAAAPVAAPETAAGGLESATLLALQYVDRAAFPQSMTLLDSQARPVSIDLTGDVKMNLQGFYETLQTTSDLTLLHCQLLPATQFVAYIPYVYFFVLPMSIGDCLQDMGQWAEAEQQYLTALTYPFLNENVEVVRVWTRLAELYLAWGDQLYRAAGNDAAQYPAAAEKFGRLVTSADAIPAASPLYASAAFAPIRARAAAVVAAADPLALDENPALVRPIVQARLRLHQIGAGLNIFGYTSDYVPPFGWEYLQTVARYFAQHAAAVEQSYIQFKSQAENEEFRRDQMEQQVELAKASVQLEQRGLAEAQAGVGVAQAGVNYAETQRQNAVAAQTQFNNTRWEQLELEELYAWSTAAAQDEDDEVHQTISGYTYYNVSDQRRSLVVQDLARRRTLLAQEQEAQRLAAEVASASAYKAVAQAQLAEAQARVATAQQRIVVAQLQQRFAEDNRDFLDMREFGARLWYELARTMRQLSRTYLDEAIEIASLMERAYAAETGRRLDKIRFDYRWSGPNQLLGADMLLADIDFFTYDYLTSTRSKKAPIKVSISLADRYPLAFTQLKATGGAMFETTLEQIDRLYPGFYLHKVRDVELVFVGLTGSGSFHGTLRNIGVSSFRDQAGNVKQLVYPADVMPISQYETRQDALVFGTDTNELRLFENNGVATMWQIELPPSANDFDPGDLLDVQVALYFDAFFDSTLESAVKATLPTTGKGAKVTSLRLEAPDELFYLRNQGSGHVRVSQDDLPRSQTAQKRTASTLRLAGDAALVSGLTLRITPASTGAELKVTADADGIVAGSAAADPLGGVIGKPLVDDWVIAIRADDNPGKPAAPGGVDLAGLTDVQAYQEYTFDYR
jgi:hypothetical protein